MTLYEGVENKVLLKLIYVFWKVMNLISDQSIGKETDLQGDYLSHKKIVEHIADRNVEKARDAIKEHFLSIEKRLKNIQQWLICLFMNNIDFIFCESFGIKK